MTRGSLCVSSIRKSGRKCYNLQYRRKTKHFSKAIPADELPAYERSTEVYREFMKYVQRYIDEQTKKAIKEIAKETKDAKRKFRKAL